MKRMISQVCSILFLTSFTSLLIISFPDSRSWCAAPRLWSPPLELPEREFYKCDLSRSSIEDVEKYVFFGFAPRKFRISGRRLGTRLRKKTHIFLLLHCSPIFYWYFTSTLKDEANFSGFSSQFHVIICALHVKDNYMARAESGKWVPNVELDYSKHVIVLQVGEVIGLSKLTASLTRWWFFYDWMTSFFEIQTNLKSLYRAVMYTISEMINCKGSWSWKDWCRVKIPLRPREGNDHKDSGIRYRPTYPVTIGKVSWVILREWFVGLEVRFALSPLWKRWLISTFRWSIIASKRQVHNTMI